MSTNQVLLSLTTTTKKRLTRREVSLNEMERVVPWSKLIALIEPAYPSSGRRGRQPMPLASMLRIHCLENWFSFSDRQMEYALSIRRFAGFASVTAPLAG